MEPREGKELVQRRRAHKQCNSKASSESRPGAEANSPGPAWFSEYQITGCDYSFPPAASRRAAQGGGLCALFRGFPNARGQRNAARSGSRRLDPPISRFQPRGDSPPISCSPSRLAPRSPATAATRPGHSPAAPSCGQTPLGRLVLPIDPLSRSQGGVAESRRIPGKTVPALAPRPGEPASPPAGFCVPSAWSSGRCRVCSPTRHSDNPGGGSAHLHSLSGLPSWRGDRFLGM